MFDGTLHWNFGLAWIAFALAVALHVADETTHGFLDLYNRNALAIRRSLHLFFPPVFTLRSFLITLGAAVLLLFALTPLAFRGTHWVSVAALPVAILAGLLNGCWHIGGSIVCRRWLPGVLTSPVLLITGTWLLWSCHHARRRNSCRSVQSSPPYSRITHARARTKVPMSLDGTVRWLM
jgi:hypothetical protein